MSDQVDEDALSVQLESSLTLEDEEDLPTSLRTGESPSEPIGLKSISVFASTPVKSSSFKTDKDLRKEVLIRNLKTTPKKEEIIAKNSTSCNFSNKYLMQPECLKDSSPGEDVLVDPESYVKPEVDVKACVLQNDEYIILDEIHSVNSSVAEIIESPSPVLDLKKTVESVKTSFGLLENKDYIDADETRSIDSSFVEVIEEPLPRVDLEKEEKPVKKLSGLDVDYISKDPSENADNNNPDWQLLQKLETDEERYKAVRERWRNLIVPEPNKDLTCFAWCRKNFPETKTLKEPPVKSNLKSSNEEDQNKGRKRTFSACAVDSPVRRGREMRNTEKRVRTVSCTRVYDDKIAHLRRHVSEECLKIDRERMFALEGLQKQYLSEKRSLSNWSLNTGYSVSKELNELNRYHQLQRKNVTVSYEDLSCKVWERKASEITALEAASAEVLAFHKFYQGLDNTAPESMVLTQEQMDEIDEINSMYDAFYKFYEE